jgi:hypothetical protein
VIVGLNTGFDRQDSWCAYKGDPQYATRITADKVNWMQAKMFNLSCWQYSTNGHAHRRCW